MSERQCRWFTSGGRLCGLPCSDGGGLCERHNRVEAVREAGAALRAATEAVAKARDAVVEAAKRWHATDSDVDRALSKALVALYDAEGAETEARAKLEALRAGS